MESSVSSACFINMTKTEQVIMVLQTGKKLSVRSNKGYTIHLYLVSELLVELWYISDSSTITKTQLTTKEMAKGLYPIDHDLNKHFLINNTAKN